MILRPAAPADLPALATLERGLFGVDAWSEATLLGELEGHGRHSVVAAEDHQIVGYALTMRSDDVTDLQRIGVRPGHRRRGIARALLDDVLAHAREQGATRMLLEVSAANTAALAFYAAGDFVEIDRRRRYYRDGSDAVVMQRPVGGPAHGGRG